MARQRLPVLQFGPFERLTTGLMNGSRRPSAVIVFFSLGASAAAGAGSFSAFPATVNLLGGRQSARTIHFFVSVFLLLFVLVHVLMVWFAGFWSRTAAMITGRIKEGK